MFVPETQLRSEPTGKEATKLRAVWSFAPIFPVEFKYQASLLS